jgi:G3E family GTPase
VEMSNGCICCTLRDDLLVEVRRLAATGKYDYLLIEGTGIAEPLPIAATFSFRDENDASLDDVARLDTMVTVVDAINLLNDYDSRDFLKARGEVAGENDERTLVDLLVEQIEFADVIVINKVSDVSAEDLAKVRVVVRGLNADARIIETDFSRVPLNGVLDTKLFNEDHAQTHPLWHKELFGFADHVPETEEYGIRSFVYRARRPLDPAKFHAVLESKLPGVMRAKGHFWLATRPDWVGELSLAGRITRTEGLGRWWAAIPRYRWPGSEEFASLMRRHWTPTWGDRRQELVFIGGAELDEQAIRAMLDDCLVGSPSTGISASHQRMPDPFPQWGNSQAA